MTGPYLHSLEVSDLSKCSNAVTKDPIHFGIDCTKSLLHYEEIVVEYPTDIHRLKQDATVAAMKTHGNNETAFSNADFLVIYNATLLTMDSGYLKNDILHDALIVVRSGEIEAIVGVHDLVIPYGATTFDAQGGFVVPGFIDVHAHWNGFADYYPARSWELETFLAYGVTTLHKCVPMSVILLLILNFLFYLLMMQSEC